MLTHLHSDIFPEAPLWGSSGSGSPVGRLAKGSRPGPGVTGTCTSLSPAVIGQGNNIRCVPVGLCPGICGCLPAVRHRGVSDGEGADHFADVGKMVSPCSVCARCYALVRIRAYASESNGWASSATMRRHGLRRRCRSGRPALRTPLYESLSGMAAMKSKTKRTLR